MSINSVSSTSALFNIQSATSTSSTTATDTTGATSGVTVDISKPGQLMSQLSALAQSDPDQFKSVTASIAQQLKNAASSQSGSSADILNKLADRFSAASQSGSASDLAPKAHGHHHGGGGGHHKMQASAGGGSAGATGGGGSDSLAQLVQGIISSTLDTNSTSTT